ncbi:zinc ribbon domain-containing protein [Entomospira culicis]|uniref:Nucleic acid-binding protein n=1 Tax=Entomospira culicis TaxID=2719989 RepID=A0A968KYX2_9SPIO|nr:C4-type zinc ribbon domain-containing protein [Entomospira culicis]NIZ18520.1 nucleic acid-binding protein [Entomospira culicis]NIZ68736.1 nucleic acid-binding protein [Entomospira culicis]WDI37332.1 C4-type zinc ribbon domain-containing protein [Entomospira culicis]WDI38961.1 C4-type zinc ribbon domain-containing protein [Entomospira culicis]
MQEVFEKLQQLQEVLAERYEIERHLSAIPKQLSTQSDVVARLRKSYGEKEHAHAGLSEIVSRLRIDLGDAQIVRESAERRMEAVKTQREFEALEKEINDAALEEDRLRHELRKHDQELQALNEAMQSELELIQDQEQELNDVERSVQKESEKDEQRLRELLIEEQRLTPDLDVSLLHKFESIIKNKLGLGIVGIRSGVCSGCHIVLPANFVNEVRMAHKVEFCPYCSRVLYFENGDVDEFFTGYIDADEMGGLIDLVDEDDFEEEEPPTLIDDEMAGDYEDN